MAAPGGVVLNKHIFGRVFSDAFKCLSDHDCEAVNDLGIWNIIGFKEGLEFAGLEITDQFLNGFNTHVFNVTIVVVLENALLRVKEANHWQHGFINTHEHTKTFLNTFRDARSNEQYLAFEFFGSLCIDFLVSRVSFLSEKYYGGVVFIKDKFFVILAEGDHTRNGRSLGKGNEILFKAVELQRRLIEVTGNDNAVGDVAILAKF